MPGIYILDIHEQDMITVFRFQRNRKENKGLDRNLIICHVICDISSFILHENNVVKLREREGQRVDLGRSLKGHLWMVDGGWWYTFP